MESLLNDTLSKELDSLLLLVLSSGLRWHIGASLLKLLLVFRKLLKQESVDFRAKAADELHINFNLEGVRT